MRTSQAGKHCKGCTDRVLGCHQTCEKYRTACEEENEYKRKVWNEKGKDVEIMGYFAQDADKRRKRH